MTSGTARFLDHCQIDVRSLGENVESIEWHPKVIRALALVEENAADLDGCASACVRVGPRADDEAPLRLAYKQRFREYHAQLLDRQARIASGWRRLLSQLDTVPDGSLQRCLHTFLGFAALDTIESLQRLEGQLVIDGRLVVRLFPDLPRIPHPSLVFVHPYHSVLNRFALAERRFLRARICRHRGNEGDYEYLTLPLHWAERYQEEFEAPAWIYYEWVLPQWLVRYEPPAADLPGWWITALLDGVDRERWSKALGGYSAGDEVPRDAEDTYRLSPGDVHEVSLEKGFAVWTLAPRASINVSPTRPDAAGSQSITSQRAQRTEAPMSIKASLLDAVTNRTAVLFAGAGISRNAIGFGGDHLRDKIAAEIRRDYPDYDSSGRSLEDVCDEYAALNDKLRLVDKLAGLIPQNCKPQPSHLAAVRAFRFIVTTNWDLLFECAYRDVGQHYQCLSAESDAPLFNYDQHNLLKIHGSVDRPSTIISTTEDYEGYADTHAQLLGKVADLLHNNTVLFVGYGLRDEHVRQLLAHIRRTRRQWTRKAFAVGFYDAVRTKLLESRDIEVIAADADTFLTDLAVKAGFITGTAA